MNPRVSYGLGGIEADQFKLIFGHTWIKLARDVDNRLCVQEAEVLEAHGIYLYCWLKGSMNPTLL